MQFRGSAPKSSHSTCTLFSFLSQESFRHTHVQKKMTVLSPCQTSMPTKCRTVSRFCVPSYFVKSIPNLMSYHWSRANSEVAGGSMGKSGVYSEGVGASAGPTKRCLPRTKFCSSQAACKWPSSNSPYFLMNFANLRLQDI